MIVCVDVDGVCADLLPAWLQKYNSDYDDNLTPEDITEWNLHPFVKPECGEKIYKYLHDSDLYLSVQTIPGALRGVQMLRELNHRVIFLTACVGAEMAAAKIDWMFDHGFLHTPRYFGMSDLIIAKEKRLIRADVLVDDYPENLREFWGEKILFDAPYNKDAKYNRANDWAGVVTKIMEMEL
jgi:5'-nucleotidase